jgi:hypothetical protein
MIRTSRTFADAAVFAVPAVFVLLWASGFIGAKPGCPYAEPMTFLTVRMGAVVLVLGLSSCSPGRRGRPRRRRCTAR